MMQSEKKLMIGLMVGSLSQITRAELVLALIGASLKSGDFDALKEAAESDTTGEQEVQRQTTLTLLRELLRLKGPFIQAVAKGRALREARERGGLESFMPDFAR